MASVYDEQDDELLMWGGEAEGGASIGRDPWPRLRRRGWLMRSLFFFFGSEWMFLASVGTTTAAVVFGLDYILDYVYRGRMLAIGAVPPAAGYFIWLLIMALMVCASVFLTHKISPIAVGSGIPEMRTVLRNMDYDTKGYLSARTLVGKLLGLILAKGSGLPIGKEGPSVHIASALAHLLTQWCGFFTHFAESKSRRMEMLAAACAVGVAANFGAPIGGVLFSIEVTASGYFAVRNYWRGFFAAVAGAFVFRLLAAVVTSTNITTLFVTDFDDYPYSLYELVAFVLLGIVCGLIGALFVFVHSRIVRAGRALVGLTSVSSRLFSNKYVTSLFVVGMIATLTFPHVIGEYMAMSHKEAIQTLFSEKPLDCFGDSDPSGPWAGSNIFVSLPVYVALNFIMVVVAISLEIPSGVFTPIFMIGAGFGRLVGEGMNVWFPEGLTEAIDSEISHVCTWNPAQLSMSYWYPVEGVDGVDVSHWKCQWNTTLGECDTATSNLLGCQPMMYVVAGGYAVVGAAALAGAVTHTISTSIIVFELTGQIQHILPVMLAVLAGNAVAQRLAPSIYDSIIQLKGLPYLPDIHASQNYKKTAGQIMNRRPATVSLDDTYTDLERMLSDNPNMDVIPLLDGQKTRTLIGAVRRAFLEQVLAQQRLISFREPSPTDSVFFDSNTGLSQLLLTDSGQSPGEASDNVAGTQPTPQATAVASPLASQEDDLAHGEHPSATQERTMDERLDFTRCVIDPTPLRVIEQTPLSQIHTMFSLLQTDVMYVTTAGRLVGTITLSDLSRAILEDGETAFQVSALKSTSSVSERPTTADSTRSGRRSRIESESEAAL